MEKRGRVAAALGISVLAWAGCSSQGAQPAEEPEPTVQQSVQQHQSAGVTNAIGGIAANAQSHAEPVVANAAGPKEDTVNSQPAQTPANKPKVSPADNYDAANPTLMGLPLRADKAAVINKFGEPKSQYILTDDIGSVQVFSYDDFSIGFRPDGKIEFIEVYSSLVDPGLRGLRVGHTAKDAIAALGNPDVNTGYVMTYVSEGSVLKLDIDADSNQVLSIKLFPQT